jgi:hypothetical protein
MRWRSSSSSTRASMMPIIDTLRQMAGNPMNCGSIRPGLKTGVRSRRLWAMALAEQSM